MELYDGDDVKKHRMVSAAETPPPSDDLNNKDKQVFTLNAKEDTSGAKVLTRKKDANLFLAIRYYLPS